MCGIAGYLYLTSEGVSPLPASIAAQMLDALKHRGPDGRGEWRAADECCWLGHTRLAIIDLHSGDQPIANEDGTVWTVYNGEIYNYVKLREELAALGHSFRTRSDTEVLVHGYEQWGITELAKKLQGIFAFAIFDRTRRTLFLVRDHIGVKPLYWWSDGKVFLFASEMKSILCYPGLRSREVNRAGIAQIIVTRYVSRPETLFAGIYRLPEASILQVVNGCPAIGEPTCYWDLREEPRSVSMHEAVAQLRTLLTQTVDMQLMSDVPLGVQLSGGVDSSMVVAIMENLRRERGERAPLRTFSVGFDAEGFSELPYARQVADRYGTEHHELAVGFKDFVDELPFLAWLYDEPMGEPPGIPTYFMCKAAKADVTVMLCGEGADELFGGYSKYVFEQFSAAVNWLAAHTRRPLLRGMGRTVPFEGRRLRTILEILGIPSQAGRFASWYGGFDTILQQEMLSPQLIREVKDGGLEQRFARIVEGVTDKDPLQQFLYCDLHTRLVDDILVKGDRMSMGASIEARVPFLDRKMVEFAARLPSSLKVHGLRSKIVLKKLAEQYLPHETIYRRKVGFTVPLTRWFVGPWRGLIENVLLSDRCLGRGYYRPEAVRRVIDDHVNRRVDREQGIWLMLALEIWHRLFVDEDGTLGAVERVKSDFARFLPRAL
jgi:asparagine synthase (glutamine-hydrolysing)